MKSRTSFGYFLLASKASLLRLFSKILPEIFTLIFPVIFPVIYRSFLQLIIIGIIMFKPINSMAWEGIDYENKTSIDIPVGNLVREGYIIQFYETKSDNFRTAKVEFIQSVSMGTEIEIFDLDSKKTRFFIMRN
jgi:hypothetical protein